MDKMTLGAVVFIIGIAVLMQALFADGIGIGNNPDFGWKQETGTIIGAILTASGLFYMIKGK